MPMDNPHAYATRSEADIQEQNPKNPKVKNPSANKKAMLGNFRKGLKSRKGGLGGSVGGLRNKEDY